MKLLESVEFTVVIIVVDLVSKRTHFISTHTIVTIENTAGFFLYYVWKLHGLPTYVILDKSPQFVIFY